MPLNEQTNEPTDTKIIFTLHLNMKKSIRLRGHISKRESNVSAFFFFLCRFQIGKIRVQKTKFCTTQRISMNCEERKRRDKSRANIFVWFEIWKSVLCVCRCQYGAVVQLKFSFGGVFSF